MTPAARTQSAIELLDAIIAAALFLMGAPTSSTIALGTALALSSTALVLPISGVESPVGRAAFAMLLFEDLALVPLIFLIELIGGRSEAGSLIKTGMLGVAVVG